MSGSVYSFRAGPTYRAASRQELFDSAMEQPLSLASTFFDQTKGGALESYGLGTAIRDMAIPEGEMTTETATRSALRLMNPLTAGYESTRLAVQAFREDSPVLDEAKYKASPYYRENIPWDAGMTEARAKALAEWNDAKQVRQYYAQKRPITSFLGNLTGQAFDPINYVPVGGPLVRAAAVARAGRIGGAVVTGAVDAATNTALAGLATRETRQRFGDDVSFQAMVSEIATAALIGSAFGGVAGAMEARTAARALADAQRSLPTLRATQEARIALNEGIDAIVNGEDINLSPNATEPLARVASEIAPALQKVDAGIEPPVAEGSIRIYHSGSVGEGQTGRWVSTNRKYAADYRGDLPLYYLDIPANDPRVTNADIPEQGVKEGFTFNFETTPQEAAQLKEISRSQPPKDLLSTGTQPESVVEAKPIRSDSSLNRTASWVIRDKATGEAVMETFNPKLVERVNTAKYEAVPIGRYLGEINGQPKRAIDASPARPDPVPEGRQQAESRIAKPDNYKAIADQYRVDPETGDFPELADIDNLRAEGRLTADDIAELDAAAATVDDAKAYSEALKTVVGCLI